MTGLLRCATLTLVAALALAGCQGQNDVDDVYPAPPTTWTTTAHEFDSNSLTFADADTDSVLVLLADGRPALLDADKGHTRWVASQGISAEADCKIVADAAACVGAGDGIRDLVMLIFRKDNGRVTAATPLPVGVERGSGVVTVDDAGIGWLVTVRQWSSARVTYQLISPDGTPRWTRTTLATAAVVAADTGLVSIPITPEVAAADKPRVIVRLSDGHALTGEAPRTQPVARGYALGPAPVRLFDDDGTPTGSLPGIWDLYLGTWVGSRTTGELAPQDCPWIIGVSGAEFGVFDAASARLNWRRPLPAKTEPACMSDGVVTLVDKGDNHFQATVYDADGTRRFASRLRFTHWPHAVAAVGNAIVVESMVTGGGHTDFRSIGIDRRAGDPRWSTIDPVHVGGGRLYLSGPLGQSLSLITTRVHGRSA